jgi:hypothetical protein
MAKACVHLPAPHPDTCKTSEIMPYRRWITVRLGGQSTSCTRAWLRATPPTHRARSVLRLPGDRPDGTPAPDDPVRGVGSCGAHQCGGPPCDDPVFCSSVVFLSRGSSPLVPASKGTQWSKGNAWLDRLRSAGYIVNHADFQDLRLRPPRLIA